MSTPVSIGPIERALLVMLNTGAAAKNAVLTKFVNQLRATVGKGAVACLDQLETHLRSPSDINRAAAETTECMLYSALTTEALRLGWCPFEIDFSDDRALLRSAAEFLDVRPPG